MRPGESRRLAEAHTFEELAAAGERLLREEEPSIEVRGRDVGERLTHVLLAQRVRGRIDAGQELREAFRAVMGEVRGVLSNDATE